jgi:hypothetical protein
MDDSIGPKTAARRRVPRAPVRRHAAAASWIFGSLILVFLIITVFALPNPTDSQRGIIRFLMALSAAFLAFFFVGGVLLKGTRPGLAISATGGFALFVLLVAFVDPFTMKVPVTPVVPRAAISVTPMPDTIKIYPLDNPAEYPDVYGFGPVTYEFRETAGTDVDIRTQNFQFFTQDGRPVSDQCSDCRVFQGGFTVRGRGTFRPWQCAARGQTRWAILR